MADVRAGNKLKMTTDRGVVSFDVLYAGPSFHPTRPVVSGRVPNGDFIEITYQGSDLHISFHRVQ